MKRAVASLVSGVLGIAVAFVLVAEFLMSDGERRTR